jgi:hypothetical protein
MSQFQTFTIPGGWGTKLTGNLSPESWRLRLQGRLSNLDAARRALGQAQRDFDTEIAHARRDGQGAIAEEKLKENEARTQASAEHDRAERTKKG